MIENSENAIQFVVLLACVFVAMYRAIKARDKAWMLLTFFYVSWAMGVFYWLLCLFFFGSVPQISVVSDLSWYAAFLFLYLLVTQVAPDGEGDGKSPVAWLGPVFTLGMAVFYMQWGKVLSNLLYAATMGLLLFAALQRLWQERHGGRSRFLCTLILIFCLLEHGLWTSSCFWEGDALFNPYYWFDFMVTACFPIFIPATKRAVAA